MAAVRRPPRRTAESRRRERLPYGTVAKPAGGDDSADRELARHVTGCVGGRTARARPGGSSSGAGIPGDCARRLAAGSARVEVRRGRRRTFSQGGECSARGRGCRARRRQDCGALAAKRAMARAAQVSEGGALRGVGGGARPPLGAGCQRKTPVPGRRPAPGQTRPGLVSEPGSPQPAGPEFPPFSPAPLPGRARPSPPPTGHCEVRSAGASWSPGETPGAAAAASSCRCHRRPLHRLPSSDLAGRGREMQLGAQLRCRTP